MNQENLVNLVLQEIYKKIDTIEIQLEKKPTAVVLFEKDSSKYKALEDKYEIREYDKSLKDCSIVIVSVLCMRGLANLAQGNSTSEEERFILKMLMKGKKVYIINSGIEYKWYKNTAPKALYNKYISYEDEITRFGIKIVNNYEDIMVKDVPVKEQEPQKKPMECKLVLLEEEALDLRGKKLISELDLKKPAINGRKSIIIDRKSIITPLASDFIRICGIEVERV